MGPDNNRIVLLDGFRGIAILLVILFHYFPFAIAGWCGVDLFFVLSGFLITGKLFEVAEGRASVGKFWLHRLLRIIPLYFLVLFLGFFLLPVLFPRFVTPSYTALIQLQGWYWTFTQNMADARFGWPANIIIIHFWSLATEMQFYLIWPLLIIPFHKKIPILLIVLTALVFFAMLFRVYGQAVFPDLHFIYRYVLLPSRIDAFAIGGLLFVLLRHTKQWYTWLFGVVALLAAAGLLILYFTGNEMYFTGSWMSRAGYTLFDLFWGGLMGLALIQRPGSLFQQLLSLRLLTVTGKYSFGMYVFHLPVLILFKEILFPQWTGWSLSLLAIVVTFTAGMASYHFFEKHFLRLKYVKPAQN